MYAAFHKVFYKGIPDDILGKKGISGVLHQLVYKVSYKVFYKEFFE